MASKQPVLPTPQDTIFQSYDRTLYKNNDGANDWIYAALGSDGSADNSSAVNVPPDSLDSGAGVGTTEQTVGGIQAGKTTFDNALAGYILGADKGVAKFYIGNTTSYINWDGTTLTVVGGVNISQLNIPDSVTANSFHVDSSGNAWWGANVATGYAGANAYVLATGAAVFKNVQIGGSSIQYTVGNSGIFSFGDGSDGSLSTSGDVTLATDKYYTDLTINNGHTFNTAGYRIFCSGTLTVNSGGIIDRSGSAGGAGGNGADGDSGAPTGGTAGTAGAALADGYLKGSVAGKVGGTGGGGGGLGTGGVPGAGTTGASTSNSIGANGVGGGRGALGGGGQSSGSAVQSSAGSGGTATASNVKLIANWHLSTLLDVSSSGSTVKFDNSAGSGSGSGGCGGGGTNNLAGQQGGGGGGGGGSGSSGGIMAIYARVIVVNSGGIIRANGGNGGTGGNGGNAGTSANDGGGGGGGGGAPGNGGQVILVYNSLTNNGTISANAGTPGAGGTFGVKHGTGQDGGTGDTSTTGTAGTIRQYQLSL